jgi:hypothetical protein
MTCNGGQASVLEFWSKLRNDLVRATPVWWLALA